ncbi:hypothetical protein BDN72DRAFT_527159 [Pluteus cervinus]|uniref:Uncharacterized protein n=1 Tax=Pluteus cervinus TaxID=181527 RepID=A0ACD3A4B0_9AGAR|nr:hypothetical protein BDN72DRAFT_527159 [Pluteus cervinus]
MTELDPNNLPDGVHYWPIDKEESSRLSSLLEYDFGSLDIAGHFVMRPQLSCSECGKFSGLDDFVHTSLRQEIHSKRFMINILKHHPISDGREHYLHCSSCDTLFVEQTVSYQVFPSLLEIEPDVVPEL